MKKSLFIGFVMLLVGMTASAQDYKKQSFIPEAAMPDAGIYPQLHLTQHLINLIMTSVSIGGVER